MQLDEQISQYNRTVSDEREGIQTFQVFLMLKKHKSVASGLGLLPDLAILVRVHDNPHAFNRSVAPKLLLEVLADAIIRQATDEQRLEGISADVLVLGRFEELFGAFACEPCLLGGLLQLDAISTFQPGLGDGDRFRVCYRRFLGEGGEEVGDTIDAVGAAVLGLVVVGREPAEGRTWQEQLQQLRRELRGHCCGRDSRRRVALQKLERIKVR